MKNVIKLEAILLLICTLCSAEPISRSYIDCEQVWPISYPRTAEGYPWSQGELPPITQEHFRCRGSRSHPFKDDKLDCAGGQWHSLPVRDGTEQVYPILIELLNYCQEKTGEKVVVTCGHRCHAHNAYADPRQYNLYSKHQIGAEVDFYVEDVDPEKVVSLIQQLYALEPRYQGKSAYTNFDRSSKGELDVATRPWHNKEIFIKLYTADEGRDFDNDHDHPYLSIQVRWDFAKGKRVSFNWDDVMIRE